MKTVGAYEAKAHLPQLLDEVERGEEIMITRHGHPVARLVSAAQRDPERIRKAIEGIRALSSRTQNIDPETLKEWIEPGRRF